MHFLYSQNRKNTKSLLQLVGVKYAADFHGMLVVSCYNHTLPLNILSAIQLASSLAELSVVFRSSDLLMLSFVSSFSGCCCCDSA
jgi:hypothetical protein